MATNRSKSAPKRETPHPHHLRDRRSALPPTRASRKTSPRPSASSSPNTTPSAPSTRLAVKRMAEAFEGSLNDKATAMHFQRHCRRPSSPPQSGPAASTPSRSLQARDATARAADGGDDGLTRPPIGLESKAQRTREFAADMAMQAYALLAAAHGAIDAYKDLTGEDWKAYEAPTEAAVEKKAAVSQMGAFAG